MSGEEKIFFQEAFDSNWIAPLGPQVDAFEKEVADYVGINHTLALSSGTAALHLALEVLDVTSGDVVFCSDLTFVASANVIRYQNATPVFIDCNLAHNNVPSSAGKRSLYICLVHSWSMFLVFMGFHCFFWVFILSTLS